jgi:hypothetical protein
LKWCIDLRIFCAEAIQFLKSVDFLLIAARSLRRRDRQSFIGYGKGSDFGGGDLDQSPSLWAVLMAYEAWCFGADRATNDVGMLLPSLPISALLHLHFQGKLHRGHPIFQTVFGAEFKRR